MNTRAVRWWAVAALASVLVPAALTAAPAPADKAPAPSEKVRADLDRPVTIHIDRQPLSVAVDMLREKTKLNLILDGIVIQQQLGFDPAQPPTPVDLDVKDRKLRSVLHSMLAPYNLSYAVVGDTILITTEDVAVGRQMRQRVSVDLDKVEFAAALKQLSRETGVNLTLDGRFAKEAKVLVSMNLEDVPLETAVRLLSEMAGLKPVRAGNVLFVTSKAVANELRADPDLNQQQGGVQMEKDLQMLQLRGLIGAPGGGVVLPGGGGFPPPGGGFTPIITDPVKVKAADDGKDAPPPKEGDK